MIKYLSEVKSLNDFAEWKGGHLIPYENEAAGKYNAVAVVENALRILKNTTDMEIVGTSINKISMAVPYYNFWCKQYGRPTLDDFDGIINKILPSYYDRYQEYQEEQKRKRELREKQALLEAQKQARLEKISYIHQSNPIPRRFTGDYTPSNKEQKEVWELLQEKKGGAIVYGMAGVGKSHLMAGYIYALQEKAINARYIPVNELLGNIKANFGNASEVQDIVHHYKHIRVLAIDDLGTESKSEWNFSQLFEIIDYRYSNNLPIFGTTNLTPSALFDRYGERMASRLLDMSAFIQLKGKNIRLLERGRKDA